MQVKSRSPIGFTDAASSRSGQSIDEQELSDRLRYGGWHDLPVHRDALTRLGVEIRLAPALCGAGVSTPKHSDGLHGDESIGDSDGGDSFDEVAGGGGSEL